MGDISVIKNQGALSSARSYNAGQLKLIRNTVAKDTTEDEFNMFVEICKRQGLDPFRRQIYALVFNKDKGDKRQVAFITGIDGYRAIAKRTGTYRPADTEPNFEIDEALKSDWNPEGIVKCTTVVHQYGPDGQWYPVVGIAHWKEFAPLYEESNWVPVLDDNGKPVLQTEGKWKGRPKNERKGTGNFKLTKDNWRTMPFVMIAKCAEAQALRKGWPEEMGGLMVSEEMDFMQAEEMSASEEVAQYEKDERIKLVGGIANTPMILAMSEGMVMVQDDKFCDTVLEVLRDIETGQEINFWMDMNKTGMQQFWAKNKSDALELKTQIDQLIKEKSNGITE